MLEEEAALLEVKDPRSWDPNARTLPLEMGRGNAPLRRLEESNQRSTAEVLQ